MMHLKNSLLFLIVLPFCSTVYGQTLSPSVISASGGYSVGSWGSLSSTIGEVEIQTGKVASVVMTQGFQQPIAAGIVLGVAPKVKDRFVLYPNPARGIVNIRTSQPTGTLFLYDNVGKILWQSKLNEREIDLRSYAIGMYQVVHQVDNQIYSSKLMVH